MFSFDEEYMHSYVGDKVETIISEQEIKNILNVFTNQVNLDSFNTEKTLENNQLLHVINFIQEQQFANIIALERIRTLLSTKKC